MLIYTGIGSRETPSEVLNAMKDIGNQLAASGWILRSGGADGADSAFEAGVTNWAWDNQQGAPTEIYLPWEGFNGRYSTRKGYFVASNDSTYADAMDIAKRFHPNWGACSPGAKAMHARNVSQILGQDLNTPTNLVICWTKEGKGGGGTGQALRIAKHYNVPIIDLGKDPISEVERITYEMENP